MAARTRPLASQHGHYPDNDETRNRMDTGCRNLAVVVDVAAAVAATAKLADQLRPHLQTSALTQPKSKIID